MLRCRKIAFADEEDAIRMLDCRQAMVDAGLRRARVQGAYRGRHPSAGLIIERTGRLVLDENPIRRRRDFL